MSPITPELTAAQLFISAGLWLMGVSGLLWPMVQRGLERGFVGVSR